MGLLRSASRTIIGLDVLFLLLLGFSFLFVEPGSAAFVVAVLTVPPIVLTLIGSAVVLYTGWDPF